MTAPRNGHGTADGNGYTIPDNKNGSGEANVVDGHIIAQHIKTFCENWYERRPIGGKYGTRTDKFYGPMQWLSDRTGIPPRRLQHIKHGRARHVNMSRADAILQAIGDGTRLEDELEPYPNPRWSQERWHAYMSERGCV